MNVCPPSIPAAGNRHRRGPASLGGALNPLSGSRILTYSLTAFETRGNYLPLATCSGVPVSNMSDANTQLLGMRFGNRHISVYYLQSLFACVVS